MNPTSAGTDPGPEATCGDGVLTAANGEECDDGNLAGDDGCNTLCKRDRTVFVSSVLTTVRIHSVAPTRSGSDR